MGVAAVVVVVLGWQLWDRPKPSPTSKNAVKLAASKDVKRSPTPPANSVARPSNPTTVAEDQQEIVHRVVEGETLWEIAERYVHDPWAFRELAARSGIENPDFITPGEEVRIPTPAKSDR